MKKVITTITLVIIMMAGTSAQVKKPKISVNTSKISTVKKLPRLKVNDLSKFKSLDDIKKLDAPTEQVTKEQENASSSQIRIINVNKLRDGDLKLVSARGSISTNPPTFWLHTKDSDNNNSVQSGTENSINTGVFPLKLSFRMVAGVEYRLKIKSSRSPYTNIIYVATQFHGQQTYTLTRLELNNQEEYNHIMQENTTGNMTLFFTAKPNPEGHYHDWMDLAVKEIQVGRIN